MIDTEGLGAGVGNILSGKPYAVVLQDSLTIVSLIRRPFRVGAPGVGEYSLFVVRRIQYPDTIM